MGEKPILGIKVNFQQWILETSLKNMKTLWKSKFKSSNSFSSFKDSKSGHKSQKIFQMSNFKSIFMGVNQISKSIFNSEMLKLVKIWKLSWKTKILSPKSNFYFYKFKIRLKFLKKLLQVKLSVFSVNLWVWSQNQVTKSIFNSKILKLIWKLWKLFYKSKFKFQVKFLPLWVRI